MDWLRWPGCIAGSYFPRSSLTKCTGVLLLRSVKSGARLRGRTATQRSKIRVLRRFWGGFWKSVLRRVLRRELAVGLQ